MCEGRKLLDRLSNIQDCEERITRLLDNFEKDVDLIIEAYAEVLCRQLCDQMRKLLLREIWNMVYGYILERPIVRAPKTVVDFKTYKLAGYYFHSDPGSKHDILRAQHF